MQATALQSAATPLDEGQIGSLAAFVQGFTGEQLLWTSGYLAGLAARDWSMNAATVPAPAASSIPARAAPWLVLYGSQTGHGRGVAERVADSFRAESVAVELASMAAFKPSQIKRLERLVLVVSTHGDGDPPDDALELYEYLTSERAPRLEKLSYAVLALGDSSYAQFCATGRLLDERLAELGAQRMLARVDCDVDYEDPARRWQDQVLAEARTQVPPETAPRGNFASADEPRFAPVATRPLRLVAVPTTPRYDRANPCSAEILVQQPIVGRGSTRDVRHVELSIEGSGLAFEPGDSLAVMPVNPPALVDQFLDALQLSADARVQTHAGEVPLGEALARHYDITVLGRPFVDAWAGLAHADELRNLLAEERRTELAAYMADRQPIDVVRAHAARVTPVEFVGVLRRLTPRLYSIASSPDALPDEVHLTVGVVRYVAHGFTHWGAASTHLAERSTAGEAVPVFVERNERFRLPADGDTPIVMIGPGTGIAPFRAFLQQREHDGARGRNWLYFGERNQRSDFLYQLEWLRHRKSGLLTRLDVAFSRDRAEKTYVQHRMEQNARELYAWLEDGAHVYVCGSTAMGDDVHATLVNVVAAGSGRGREHADEYVRELRRTGRYARDVY
jgi:sulfite reductase (NADPH) flavoprotein alpha-component